ncbi:hypothetical protein [Streptomyces anulatus]|uniref:hypothetical protein n=1 Tax=Streptomyces anulatus TaxID=1892 RepID=UPI00324795BC
MRIRRSRLTGDFLQVPNATVRDDRLSHMARGILAELLSRPDGWEATADDMWRSSVAKHGKNSPGRRMFRAAFAELKEHGYLTAGRELLAAGRHATVLTLTDVPQAGTSARPADADKTAGGTDVPHGGTSDGSTDVPDGGTSVRPGQTALPAAQPDVPAGGTSVSAAGTGDRAGHSDVPHGGTSKEENGEKKTGWNTSSSTPRGAGQDSAPVALAASLRPRAVKPTKDEHLKAFGAFYLVYPKRREPEKAKKAWIAAMERGVDPQHVIEAATRYAKERAGENSKYTKYPATWLNNGCYDDEFDEPRRPHLRAVGGYDGPWTSPEDPNDYEGDL